MPSYWVQFCSMCMHLRMPIWLSENSQQKFHLRLAYLEVEWISNIQVKWDETGNRKTKLCEGREVFSSIFFFSLVIDRGGP